MRPIGKLKALTVAREKRPGVYGDGGGLWLQVTGAGAKSWIFRYWVPERDPATGELLRDPATGKIRGVTREMGLGSCTVVSLEDARRRALECRQLREKGIDPIEARRGAKVQAVLEQAKSVKFSDAAVSYIASHKAGWRSDRHAAQWPQTLSAYAYPVIGDVPVQAINTALVMKVLEPVWTTKPETASRLRGRIESVLSWATVRGYRTGENPARWRGHLDHLLAARAKVARVEHHAAMPHAEVAGFMRDLRRQDGVAARALEFLVLTATRVGEVIGARWGEIDMLDKTWTVPAERMKAQREHRVPLSPRALEILKALPRESDFVFPDGRDRALSNKAMLRLLVKRMARPVTVHGFRSCFRVWAAEQTNFPSEVAEAALAHVVSNKVIEAYRRTDFFDRRRRLMDEWARFCGKPAPAHADKKVVSLRLG
jgi:integrase